MHLQNLYQILMFSNATPIKSTITLPFNCVFCPTKFTEASTLKTHILTAHDDKKLNYMRKSFMHSYLPKLDITNLQCSICQTQFNILEDFMIHLNKVHKKKMYLDLKNHILQFKFDSSKFLSCVFCPERYTSLKSLQEHMNKTHHRNYICEDCDEGFINKRMMNNHKYRNHGTGLFKCDHCDKEFDNQTKRKNHERCVHQETHRWKCPYCSERFNSYRNRSVHFTQVHDHVPKLINCQACNQIFESKLYMNRHMKRFHLLERNHQCTECNMSFFSSNELKNHVIKHTGQRDFKCDVCSKTYSRKKTLREHMRIHTNDRRFACDDCGQSFIQKCSWKSHVRSKHGIMI